MKLDKNRILVAMSGGVDSSVAITKLHEQGYETIGITLKLWENEDPITKTKRNSLCNSTEAINGAKMVCDRIGVHHYTLDCIQAFKKNVVDDFSQQYLNGRTPNPCVKCNSEVKWASLIEQANKLGAFYIATGHYAKINNNNQEICIEKGLDPIKDQSYMLWHIEKKHLERTIFPIGNLTKEEVREYAKKNGLETSNTPDSQDLCFVVDGDYRNFLYEIMPDEMQSIKKGSIIDEEGITIGEHSGFTNYTIGQRKGLKLSFPEPRYVKKINPINNTITVSKKDSMYSKFCVTNKINWHINNPDLPLKTHAKIRYNSMGAEALVVRKDDHFHITFKQPQLAVTPGQSIVFYDDKTLLGGGIIE